MSQQINLFNPVFLKQEKLFSARAMGQGMVLMACGLVLLFIVSQNRLSASREQASVMAKRLQLTRGQLAALVDKTRPATPNPNLDADIHKLESRLAGSRNILEFLRGGELGGAAGYSDMMRGFSRAAMPGVWLSGFAMAEGGQRIDISGHALQPGMVPAYIKRLGSDAAFKGKSFSSVMLRAPLAEPAAANDRGGKAGPAPAAASVEFFLSSGDVVGEAGNLKGATRK